MLLEGGSDLVGGDVGADQAGLLGLLLARLLDWLRRPLFFQDLHIRQRRLLSIRRPTRRQLFVGFGGLSWCVVRFCGHSGGTRDLELSHFLSHFLVGANRARCELLLALLGALGLLGRSLVSGRSVSRFAVLVTRFLLVSLRSCCTNEL